MDDLKMIRVQIADHIATVLTGKGNASVPASTSRRVLRLHKRLA